MKKVYYIGGYTEDAYADAFFHSVPGKLKLKYVYDKIVQNGQDAKIISLCHKEKRIKAKSTDKIKYFFSIPKRNKYIKILNLWLIRLQLLFTYLFQIKKEDTVVLYHSYTYTHFFCFLRKLKKVPAILQVEEVYGFSATGHLPYLEKEIRDIRSFDRAIFVNDYIPKELGFQDKSYVVSYGVCNLTPPETDLEFRDGKIHALYAGTIEEKKLGGFSAARAAEFLPDDFRVDIYGFGTEDSLDKLRGIIAEVNGKAGFEKVRYLGYVTDARLSVKMGAYDIGLSTNIIEPDFANNTFPSKTINYMSHGLSIVSGYAEVFDGIPLTKHWSFFREFTPRAIAKAIMDYKPCTLEDNLNTLRTIDRQLSCWLKENIT